MTALSCTIRELPPDHPRDHPPSDEADPIELVKAEPDRAVYELVGEVQAAGTADDMGVALGLARAKLKTQASWYHATLVVVDSDHGERLQFAGSSSDYQVLLTGRAFRKRPQKDAGP
jgi:hypothetical protein